MSRSTIFPLADKALGGTLEARLRAAREKNESFDEIAIGLRADDIRVSGETVRQWCHTLGIEEARAERAS